MAATGEATIDDLARVRGKAELVNGRLRVMTPGSGRHGRVAGRIFASLLAYETRTKRGCALPDNVGFVVRLPNRRSFSPDAAFCTQSVTNGFIDGAPIFAVEVRSIEDYGAVAEEALAAKRADYFAAGTQVVWDVDELKGRVVRVYRAHDARKAAVYRIDERADAEPALPGWSMLIDDLFSS